MRTNDKIRSLAALPESRVTLRRPSVSRSLHAVSLFAVALIAVCIVTSPLAAFAASADERAGHDHSAVRAANTPGPVSMPESKSQVMKVTDDGIDPPTLKLRPEDSVVFFLNDTTDSLLSFEIEFKDHVTHCGGGNLQVREHGIVATKQPLEPRAFNASCFHEPGTYPVRVLGLKRQPQGVEAKVVVEQ